MSQEILSSFATADYRLVAEPPAALRASLFAVKKHFAAQYDCPAAAGGRADITLLRFTQYEMQEARILRRLEPLIAERASFLVALNGFGSFPSHTIFFSITTQTQLLELVKSFRPMQQLLTMDQLHKPHFIHTPYINLAVKLLPWQYEKGWLEMHHTHFSGKFMAEQLVLLRKRAGEKNYAAVKRFGLKNERKEVVQGNLF